MARRYTGQAEFLGVYVREAHPIDGWRSASNDEAGIAEFQPKSDAERLAVAKKCSAHLKSNIPLVVDTIDDRVGHLYSGMPDRLYILDSEGRVVYKSGRGPFGFNPGEMEQVLLLTLMEGETARAAQSLKSD